MRVLLIEDDTVIGSAVREQIEEGGHSVDWAQRLDAAQDALDSAAFDLILLDLMLPDGRGIAFLKGLRARCASARAYSNRAGSNIRPY
jgi:two-component system OmpR family response regulator